MERIKSILFNIYETGKGDFWGSVMFSIAVLIFFLLRKKLTHFWKKRILNKTEQGENYNIEKYFNSLYDQNFKIRHSWLKEEHTLEDVIIDVDVDESKKQELRLNLEKFIKREFGEASPARILIMGDPGSGKTITSKLIAINSRKWIDDRSIIPILIKFSDLKGLNTGIDYDGHIESFKNRIARILDSYQFNHELSKQFVSDNLTTGRILLIIDGFDEIERKVRNEIAQFLNQFLTTYLNIPVILTTRTSVYYHEKVFVKTINTTIKIAPFSPILTLKFLTNWGFQGGKSALELFNLIRGRTHLSDIASNPLMLTILSFLYSQPKYTLPDNRIEFYEETTRALLEKWDLVQNSGRSNKFKTRHKNVFLAALAAQQIKKGETTDEEINTSTVLKFARILMKKIGLIPSQDEIFVSEIINNSGLLSIVSEYGLRFPHRTFMEYYAAKYILESRQDMLELYQSDPGKWSQTLIFYCGLNEDIKTTNIILNELIVEFKSNSNKKAENESHLIFQVLLECATPDPEISIKILALGFNYLTMTYPDPIIIEFIGHISSNKRWQHSLYAEKILLKLKDYQLKDEALINWLIALLGIDNTKAHQIILQKIGSLDLKQLLSKIGEQSSYFIKKILYLELSKSQKLDLVKGLEASGDFNILFELFIESKDKVIVSNCSYSLARMSALGGFYDTLNNVDYNFSDKERKEKVEALFNEWDWDWPGPSSDNAKRVLVSLCYEQSRSCGSYDGYDAVSLNNEIDSRIRYLTFGLNPLNANRKLVLPFTNHEITYSKQGLKTHWKLNNSLDRLTFKLFDVPSFIIVFNLLILTIGLGLFQIDPNNSSVQKMFNLGFIDLREYQNPLFISFYIFYPIIAVIALHERYVDSASSKKDRVGLFFLTLYLVIGCILVPNIGIFISTIFIIYHFIDFKSRIYLLSIPILINYWVTLIVVVSITALIAILIPIGGIYQLAIFLNLSIISIRVLDVSQLDYAIMDHYWPQVVRNYLNK